MLSATRSLGWLYTSKSATQAPRRAQEPLRRSKLLKPSSGSHTVVRRHYARWSKVVSKMSPETLAKMRDQAAKSGRTSPSGMSIRTSNTVGDPWLAPRMTNPFASKFWKDLLNWGKHLVAGYVVAPRRVASLTKQLKLESISRKQIRAVATETYQKYNQTLSTFNTSSMASFCSDKVLGELRSKFGKTVLPIGSKPTWEAQGLKASILNYVVVQTPAPLNLNFIQVTVKFSSAQKFAVHDSTGKLILGSEEFKPVQDIWVLEKIVEKPELPWTIVATHLEHPDDVKDRVSDVVEL